MKNLDVSVYADEAFGLMPAVDHGASETVGPSSQLVRLWLVPIVTSVLLAGGVYWLRQLPAGARLHEPATTVQVQLIRAPDPTTLSVPAAREPVAHDPGEPDEPSVAKPNDATREDGALLTPSRPSLRIERSSSIRPLAAPVHSFPSSVASTFQRALLRHIARYQNYPDEARGARLQGVVQLVFAMTRDGIVLDVWIKSSSGSSVLDQAALDAVRRAQPLPRIPSELPDRLNILVPVSFALS
jgi:protein TonB